MTTTRVTIAAAVTERQWQDTVVEYAQLRGWLVAHFRPARTDKGWRTPVAADGAGFPDLVMVRCLADDQRVVVAELKSEAGKVSLAQRRWLHAFRLLSEVSSHLEVHLWRPSDWAEVESTLR